MSHDNWETPKDLLEVVRAEFSFDLDAAADKYNAVCPKFIDMEQNALTTRWTGTTVWCNPPYTMKEEFIARAYDQHQHEANDIVLLLPADTDTKWWANYALQADEIRFLVGRLRFLEDGKPGKDTARFPSALIIFKHHYGVRRNGPSIWWWDWRNRGQGVEQA